MGSIRTVLQEHKWASSRQAGSREIYKLLQKCAAFASYHHPLFVVSTSSSLVRSWWAGVRSWRSDDVWVLLLLLLFFFGFLFFPPLFFSCLLGVCQKLCDAENQWWWFICSFEHFFVPFADLILQSSFNHSLVDPHHLSLSLSLRALCVCVCVSLSLSPSSTLSLSAAAGPTAAVITSYSPSAPGPPNSAPTDQQLSACHHQPSLKCLNSFVCPMICHTQ